MSIGIQNGGIVLLVIGAGLLVVGLIGGGIEVREVRIPRIGAIPRIGIFLFGIIFLLIGIGLSVPSSPPPPDPAPTATSQPPSTAQPTPTPFPSATWKAIINATDVSIACGDYITESGYIYLLVDVSLVNLSDQTQVLSSDSFDLQDSSGGHYDESQCSHPGNQWSVSAGQSIRVAMAFIVPDVQTCFDLSVLDAEHRVSDTWSIGCTKV